MGPLAWHASSHSLGVLRGEGNLAIRGRRHTITPLLLPLLAVQTSAGPGYLSLWLLGSCQVRLACTLGQPCEDERLKGMGDSVGRCMAQLDLPGGGPRRTIHLAPW